MRVENKIQITVKCRDCVFVRTYSSLGTAQMIADQHSDNKKHNVDVTIKHVITYLGKGG